MSADFAPRNIRTIDSIFFLRVDVEVLKIRIEPVDDVLDSGVILEENEEKSHEVEDRQTEDSSPDDRMWTSEWSIREGKSRDDEEEEDNTADSRPIILFNR